MNVKRKQSSAQELLSCHILARFHDEHSLGHAQTGAGENVSNTS